jgi:hypothetical protein
MQTISHGQKENNKDTIKEQSGINIHAIMMKLNLDLQSNIDLISAAIIHDQLFSPMKRRQDPQNTSQLLIQIYKYKDIFLL